jgi:uncharacterized protein with von Willebrand factor type A (vWA) domain
MKTFKIEIPEGYEIDQEKSTFEKIVFKEINKELKKELPKSWEELIRIEGYYVGTSGYVCDYQGATSGSNKNLFATQEQAEAAIALAQLSQLREVYRQGWTPDWKNDHQVKHCIYLSNSVCEVAQFYDFDRFLSFQSKEVANEFLENFGSLIEQARPLMS